MWHTTEKELSTKETLREELEKSVTFEGKQRKFRIKILCCQGEYF
jgi:hypothetical protein